MDALAALAEVSAKELDREREEEARAGSRGSDEARRSPGNAYGFDRRLKGREYYDSEYYVYYDRPSTSHDYNSGPYEHGVSDAGESRRASVAYDYPDYPDSYAGYAAPYQDYYYDYKDPRRYPVSREGTAGYEDNEYPYRYPEYHRDPYFYEYAHRRPNVPRNSSGEAGAASAEVSPVVPSPAGSYDYYGRAYSPYYAYPHGYYDYRRLPPRARYPITRGATPEPVSALPVGAESPGYRNFPPSRRGSVSYSAAAPHSAAQSSRSSGSYEDLYGTAFKPEPNVPYADSANGGHAETRDQEPVRRPSNNLDETKLAASSRDPTPQSLHVDTQHVPDNGALLTQSPAPFTPGVPKSAASATPSEAPGPPAHSAALESSNKPKPTYRRKKSSTDATQDSESSKAKRKRGRSSEKPVPGPPIQVLAEDAGIIQCVCGSTEDDGFTVQCESCNAWVHATCVGIANVDEVPDVFTCPQCAPEQYINAKKSAKRAAESGGDEQTQVARRRKVSSHKDALPHKTHPTSLSQPSVAPSQEYTSPLFPNVRHDFVPDPPSHAIQSTPIDFVICSSLDLRDHLSELFSHLEEKYANPPSHNSQLNPAQLCPQHAFILSDKISTFTPGPALLPYAPGPASSYLSMPTRYFRSRLNAVSPSNLPPYNHAFSAESDRSYPEPSRYGFYASANVPAGSLIGLVFGDLIQEKLFSKNPRNRISFMGVPEPCVFPLPPAFESVLDARRFSNPLSNIRKGCHPNVFVRPIVYPEDNKETLAPHPFSSLQKRSAHIKSLHIGVVAISNISKKDELVAPWEWASDHLVHTLPELFSRSLPDLQKNPVHGLPLIIYIQRLTDALGAVLDQFQCACEDKRTCVFYWTCRLGAALVAWRDARSSSDTFASFVYDALHINDQDKMPSLGPLIGASRSSANKAGFVAAWDAAPADTRLNSRPSKKREKASASAGLSKDDVSKTEKPSAARKSAPRKRSMPENDTAGPTNGTEPEEKPLQSQEQSQVSENEQALSRAPESEQAQPQIPENTQPEPQAVGEKQSHSQSQTSPSKAEPLQVDVNMEIDEADEPPSSAETTLMEDSGKFQEEYAKHHDSLLEAAVPQALTESHVNGGNPSLSQDTLAYNLEAHLDAATSTSAEAPADVLTEPGTDEPLSVASKPIDETAETVGEVPPESSNAPTQDSAPVVAENKEAGLPADFVMSPRSATPPITHAPSLPESEKEASETLKIEQDEKEQNSPGFTTPKLSSSVSGSPASANKPRARLSFATYRKRMSENASPADSPSHSINVSPKDIIKGLTQGDTRNDHSSPSPEKKK